ncbi:hypothetical protein J6590_076873 [Homalodisca vitripennis]|nr:hypothetical protein J6590_076873 [Homalodisca vitripennis]
MSEIYINVLDSENVNDNNIKFSKDTSVRLVCSRDPVTVDGQKFGNVQPTNMCGEFKGVPPSACYDWRGWYRFGLPFFRGDMAEINALNSSSKILVQEKVPTPIFTHPEYPVLRE